MMIKKIAVGIVLLSGIASVTFSAERKMVAGYMYYLNEAKDTLSFELGEDIATSDRCQGMEGLRLLQVAATSPSMYPRMIPVGVGCWYPAKNGNVIISYISFSSGKVVENSFSKKKFTTTVNFTNWDDYMPVDMAQSVRPPKDVLSLIAKVDKLATSCAQANPDTQREICRKMAIAVDAVGAKGWCFGPPDSPPSDKRWVRCK